MSLSLLLPTDGEHSLQTVLGVWGPVDYTNSKGIM